MAETGNTTTGIAANGDETKSRKERTLTRVLPTDRIAFDKQVALLRGFAAVHSANGGQPVTNEKAGEVLNPKLSASTVTQTNGFFSDVGLLNRSDKGGFVPSPELIAYNKACQWDQDAAKEKLRPIFAKTWFYRSLVPRIQLAPQSERTVIGLFAEESGAFAEHEGRLEYLIRFLELAGIVSTQGGLICLAQVKATPPVKEDNKVEESKDDGSEQHVLYLDSKKERRVTLSAPLAISRAEYDRICKWLEVALIVEDPRGMTA